MQQNDKVVGNSGADLAGILKGEIEFACARFRALVPDIGVYYDEWHGWRAKSRHENIHSCTCRTLLDEA